MAMTEPENPARTDALAAAVPGARGWFRLEDAPGAVNLRQVMALQIAQYGDNFYRVIAIGVQTYALAVGPYDTSNEADATCTQILELSLDDTAWPAAPTAP